VNDDKYPADGPPPPPRWVAGRVQSNDDPFLAARVATSDDPITHRSFDLNIDLQTDPEATFLTGASRDQTSAQDHLHLERESQATPQFAWPNPGDRLSALGSWVWDCDHYLPKGEKTEFHPFRAAWVIRNHGGPSPTSKRGESEGDLYVSTDATPAGMAAQCAHETKGSDQFKACSHATAPSLSANGSYELEACAPRPAPRGSSLRWRMVDRGSVNAPRIPVLAAKDGCATLRFSIDAPGGQRVVVAKQLYLGWSRPASVIHLRVHFDRLLVRRAMDPSCSPDQPSCKYKGESTLLGQIAPAPGEWQLTWSVDGIWGTWPGTLAARDGSTFVGRQSVDFYVSRGGTWTLVVLARECDFGALPSFDGPGRPMVPCPRTNEVGNSSGDDYAGSIQVVQRVSRLGRFTVDAATAGSTCPASNTHGCYQLTYTVSRVR
jgi:hypothetical protein